MTEETKAATKRKAQPKTPGAEVSKKQMPEQAEETKAAASDYEILQAAKVADSPLLPDQKDVDPRKIKKAILTRQGYVCPVKD